MLLINDRNIFVEDFFVNDLNIIELEKQEDIFEVYTMAKNYLTRNMEIEKYTSILFGVYMENKGLNIILETASAMINNPLVLIDLSYKVLGHSNINKIKDEFWLENIKQGYCSYEFIVAVKNMKSVQEGRKGNAIYEVSSGESPTLKLISKVKINNKHVANVILLEDNENIRYKNKVLLKVVSRVIGEELKKNRFYINSRESKYEEFIYNFLEDKSNRVRVHREICMSQSLKFGDKLTVLVLDISKYNELDKRFGYLKENITMLFSNSILIYYKDNIVVINDKEDNKSSEEFLEEVKTFLVENKIYMGISREFSDIFQCKKYYKQAVKAVNFRNTMMKDKVIMFYSDIQFYDVLLENYDKDNYKDFCDPIVICLKEYDSLKNTELYNALYVYLKNDKNIEKMANELFIHRNTARYRIQKIINLTNIDFSDMDRMVNIYLSYKLYGYMSTIN
ncbi:PucR family transcriptional regulator [Clostridium sp. DL1XJH146]